MYFRVFFFIFFGLNFTLFAQVGRISLQKPESPGSFIQNKGQYGKAVVGYESLGTIDYGYEGFGMPVLFTPRGIVYLQRKIEQISHREEELFEKRGLPEEEIERKRKVTDRIMTMEWLGASTGVQVIAEEKTPDYHTYGMLPEKVPGFRRIVYKNMYPGIDVVYTLGNNAELGFEYSLLVKPGAKLSAVKLKIGGDVKTLQTDADGGIVFKSDIGEFKTSVPVSFYGENTVNRRGQKLKSSYRVSGKELGFVMPGGYDSSKALVVDPFVTSTSSLAGLNAGKAKDVDFDYNGNIYVTGGGSFTTTHSLAKYDASGALLWTFNGTLTIPSWTFGTYYGGWMVEKPTGNIYLGQGFNPATGFQVIRVSTTGLYDNYITTANPNFREAWKMFWSCNNGSPRILIAGGGTNSNINFGVFTPPSTTISSLNVTGIGYSAGNGWAQDIADFVFDPATNDMYTIYGSLIGTPSLGNKIYKNAAPYSAASVIWNVSSGYNTVKEAANRPYLVASGLVDNSANMLWVNASYLYYWDGKNLKAFNKANGAGVGTPVTTVNIPFMQGGIIADACDNIFVGEANGTIKVYHFNGNVFSDAPPDISIPGFSGKAVYDLAYDDAKKILYASGDGFVASFDVSAYCPATPYTVNVVPDCVNASATATVSPVPPLGSTVTYVLKQGNNQVATNTTGVFTGLQPNINYTVLATINLACSGLQATRSFAITGPLISKSQLNASCGSNTGSITVTGSGSTGPYSYSINGGAFQPSGNFTGLAAGVYAIVVKDANGCLNRDTATLLNANGPVFTYTKVNADCGSNDGTVTINATGGTPPYQYSSNGGTTFQSGNFFTGLVAGQYTLVVRDATGCTNTAVITITSTNGPQLNAIPAAATCGNNNGTITVFGSGGTAPLTYSINGNTFQAGNVFSNLVPGTYTVTVRDANGCIKTASAVIANSAGPTVSAIATAATCNNANGTITATGNGGVAPRQFSINGTLFQPGNTFTGLAPGVYTITVKDATGCTSITTATVATTNGPTATATSVSATCNTANGSITVSGTGTPSLQYSINGTTFQFSGLFTGLPAGNYIGYVKDGAGCIGAVSVTVPNAAGPTLTAVATPSSCKANDGIITATGTGGLPPLLYSINGTLYAAGNVFSGLAPGSYTVYVKDANNCIKTATATVANASGLGLSISSISSSCAAVNGSLTISASGGTPPLQYSLNGTIFQPGNVFSGLSPGNYTVFIKDANGCQVTKPATVSSVAGPAISVVTTNANCTGANGIIEINGSGGVAPLTFSINGIDFFASGLFINLAPNSYNATVKDAAGCTSVQLVTITTSGAGPGITSFTVKPDSAYLCNADLGKISDPRVNGANCASCTFSLDFGSFVPNANPVFTGVSVGKHYVTAKNASGCTKTIQVSIGIGIPSTATAVVTGTACNGSSGSIKITGVGPKTPYHASISGIGGPWFTFDLSHTFSGLTPGTYEIIMADDASFDIGPPIVPGGCLDTIIVIVPSIGGPTLALAQVPGTCGGSNGTITATGSGGTPPLEYSIDNGPFQSSGVFPNQPSGIHLVTVSDANGCMNSKEITLDNQSPPAVEAITLSAACGIANGSVTATGSGGTAPYEYSIDAFTFKTGNVFSNLAAGTYTLYVKDAGGCYSTTPVTVGTIAQPKVTAITVAASCNGFDGMIIANGTLGTSPYQFSLDGTVFQSSNTFAGLAAGFYTITIKDDRGCTNTTGIAIPNAGGPSLAAAAVAAKCGTSTGSITITASGGTNPLSYSKDGTTFQPSNSFAGLLPGTYTVFVKDANGCTASKVVLVSNVNGPQTLTAAVANSSCGLSNGSVIANASGGTAPLQYSVNGINFQPGTLFSGLAAGPYTLTVKDANGCTKTLAFAIDNLAGPAVTATSSPASCGLADGTVTAEATGGTLPVTFSRNGVSFQASNVFTGLAAGDYTITVKDAKGCIATTLVTVSTTGGSVMPIFNPITPVCTGTPLTPLPTTSINGITGTWSPALNNLATTVYTFTPNPGQCALPATLTITILPKPAPIVISHN